MKFISTLAFLLFFSVSFSQWTRVEQLPATDIFSLFKKDSILYAGGNDIVYISKNRGRNWDSTTLIPNLTSINAIIVYKDELFAGSYGKGVYKSPDGGATWQNAREGLYPFISEFCEWKDNLYSTTLGDGVYKLDPTTRDRWAPFNDGLSTLSLNLNTIAANQRTMIAGTLANALYDRFSDESTHWEEKFMLNQIDPNQTIWDMISVHDTLFTAGTSKFYISTDNGVSWNRIGNQLLSTYNNLLNAREALLVARNIFNGVTNNTTYYYLKKSELASAFVPFSSVLDHFSYRMAISDNKIWDASSRGLYYLSLSELPGISDPDDHGSDTVIPPVEPGNYPFTVGHVYPNPVAGEAHLSLSLDTTRTVSASLYDLAGRQVSVIANHQHLAAGNNTISFRMDNLGSGIYFLRLQVNNDIFKREIIHIN